MVIHVNLIRQERGNSQAAQLLDAERMLSDIGEPDMLEEAVGDREKLLDDIGADLLTYSAMAFISFSMWRDRTQGAT